MSKIKSNFRISLDLFESATFGTNYGLQTVNETVTRCPKVALWYFVPLAAKHFLEVINTLVFCQPCFPKYPRTNSPTDLHPEIFVITLEWCVLCAMVLSPVELSKVRGRYVCMPMASIHPPAYFRDNVRHLF